MLECLRALLPDRLQALKIAANYSVNVLEAVTLYVKNSYFRVRVFFGVVRNSVFELCTSVIDRFLNGHFPLEGKIVPYNSGPVHILASKDIPEKQKTKAMPKM